MAYTITQLETQIATYLGRNSVLDLTQNGQDIGLYALNSARREAEQSHDFKLSEINAFLSITSTGGAISSASTGNTLVVTGSLTPNATGTYTANGTFSGYTLYVLAGSTTYFIYFNPNLNSWAISSQLSTGGSLSPVWVNIAGGPNNFTGTYNHGTGATGNATVTASGLSVNIKRIRSVLLPLSSGEYEPIEFLSDDEYISRIRKLIGRQAFNPAKNLAALGVGMLQNPLCYQQGQTLFLAGPGITLPMTAQLFVTQFMPEYTTGSQTDWFTTYAPEYLYWKGVAEANKYYKRFTTGRVEGQIDTANVEAYADAALQSLIAWDISTVRGTSTPGSQGQLQPPTPVTPAPPAIAA